MIEPRTCPTCGTPLGATAACAVCLHEVGLTAGAAGAQPFADARRSRLAVAGGLATGAGAAVLAAAWVIGRASGPHPSSAWVWLLFTGVPVAVIGAGWIASIVAWVRIHSSNGRLRGRAWAVTGTFLPLVLSCAGAPLAFFDPVVTGPEAPEPATQKSYFVAESADGSSVKIPPEDERRIDELWARACRLPARPTLADAEDLYSRSDREVLKSLNPAGLAKDARAGEFGLPLLPRDVLSCPDLSMYSLTRVRFGAPIASDRVAPDCRAVATATDGRRVIRFTLTRDSSRSEWYFGAYKVEFE